MRNHCIAVLLAITPALSLLGQGAGKPLDILGIQLGANQIQAKEMTTAIFPASHYQYYDATSKMSSKVIAYAYDRTVGGHDQFGVGFAQDDSIYFLVHTLEYNDTSAAHPNAPSNAQGGKRQIEIHIPWKRTPKPAQADQGKSAPAQTGTDLNLRPTLESFLDALIEKYGPPTFRQDKFLWYSWFLDSNYRTLSPDQVSSVCTNAPEAQIVYTNTSGPMMIPGSGPLFGHSFPVPPAQAMSNCGIGIWVHLSTKEIEGVNGGPQIVSGYSIEVYDLDAAYRDIKARQAELIKGQNLGQHPKL